MKNRKAFTLAEVLVTLAVIGVVAALTIPAIVNNSENAGSATGAKQAVSLFSDVFGRLAISEGGNLSGNCFATSGADQHLNAFDCIKPYLKIVKECRGTSGCWFNDGSEKPYKWLNGEGSYDFDDEPDTAKAILSNGMSIRFTDIADGFSHDCGSDVGNGPLDKNVCGGVHVDVNGKNGPNIVGRDVFAFVITSTGQVIPDGSDYYNDGTHDASGSDYDVSCNTSTASGYGCLGKILREGKINY